MTRPHPVTAVVVIPARNEAARIGPCLHALAQQGRPDVAIVIVANNCDDATTDVACAVAADRGLRLAVLDINLMPDAGVGTARRLGCDHALATFPAADALLCTDADCLAAPDWISRNLFHLTSHAAVCGHVSPMAEELGVLDDIDVLPAEMEAQYEALVLTFYRRARPSPLWLSGDHGHAAGASLGLSSAAYRAVGGFADLVTGEDRDLVRRLKTAGHGVLHAGDVRVTASCRLDGRARNGMAAALRARADRTNYIIDDALPSARFLIDAVRSGTLGPWPLHVAASDRLRARDLAPQIALLGRSLKAAEATADGQVREENPADILRSW